MEVKLQLVGVGFLLPPCGSEGSNSVIRLANPILKEYLFTIIFKNLKLKKKNEYSTITTPWKDKLYKMTTAASVGREMMRQELLEAVFNLLET